MTTALNNLQYGRVEPYISLTELKFSTTASAVDLTNLVENANRTGQDRALYENIIRASSKIDVFCMGRLGTLNATTNAENGRYRPNRQGQFIISPKFRPIQQVLDFAVGVAPGIGLQSVPISNNNCSIEDDQFVVTGGPASAAYVGPAISFAPPWKPGMKLFCTWTYVNGWANTFTTESSVAGAEVINVVDPTAFYPGQNFTIWDGMNDEYVQVNEDYDGTSNAVPLAQPLLFKHGVGVNVSALPAEVKQACIHFVVHLIKSRGQGGVTLQSTGDLGAGAGERPTTSSDDEAHGYDLLEDFRNSWGRA